MKAEFPMYTDLSNRPEPGPKRLAAELPVPEWIQEALRVGNSPENLFFHARGRNDDLVMSLISRGRKEPVVALPFDRFQVVGLGDLHSCDIPPLIEDLHAGGIVTSSGKLVESLEGWLLQIGDTVDRGPSGDGVYHYLGKLQEQSPAQVKRLLGNHEIAHLHGYENAIGAPSLPGFRNRLIEDILTGRVIAAACEGDTLYTHAGVDITFFPEFREMSLHDVVYKLNLRLQELVLQDRDDDPIFDTKRGIFWKRDEVGASLAHAPFRQVVGHTPQVEGIQAMPGSRVKYIDAGRVFAELGYRGFDQEWGREFMVNSEVVFGKGWGRL